jgi:uncharacterized protein
LEIIFSFFQEITILDFVFVLFFSLIAGFMDAIVGGGGLIQLPALMISLPQTSLPTLFGTNKIAAISGTSLAAYQYAKKITFHYKLLWIIGFSALIASWYGATVVSKINPEVLKPLVLVLLIAMAVYTFIKKQMGNLSNQSFIQTKTFVIGILLGIVIGFYDGFFGPGTGSFLVFGMVLFLRFDFLHASAYAKIINILTNIGALSFFIYHENYLLIMAIGMAICNIVGNYIGTKMAFKKGNEFIRKIFLAILCLMIFRYGWEVFTS